MERPKTLTWLFLVTSFFCQTSAFQNPECCDHIPLPPVPHATASSFTSTIRTSPGDIDYLANSRRFAFQKMQDQEFSEYARVKRQATPSLAQESMLKRDLLFNGVYDRTSRPVRNDLKSISVKAGISLYHVLDIDEKHQLLSCVISIRLSWFDQFLQWNKSDYDNVKSMLLPSSLIWLPDIKILNSAEPSLYATETNVIVSNNGFVLWMFPSIVKTYCLLDLSWFPFDTQNCNILLSPLSYDIRQLKLKTSASNNASYYDEQGQEWTVVSILASRLAVTEPLSEHKFLRINFRITLKRKALFYMYTWIFPCILIYLVSLLSFFLPVHSQGGKIELPLTSLLSIVVLQMSVADSLAATDKVPLIAKVYAWTMLLCCTSVVFSVATTVVSQQKRDKRVPRTLKMFTFPELAVYSCLGRPEPTYTRERKRKPSLVDMPDDELKISAYDNTRRLSSIESNTLIRIGSYMLYGPNLDPQTDWELVGTRINLIFFFLFMIMSIAGYAFCLPSLNPFY